MVTVGNMLIKMKRNILLLLVIQVIFLGSCKDDEEKYILKDYIQAGQKEGTGIKYVSFDPGINCTIIDPWNKTDTTINLDLNKDGVYDFTIVGAVCHPTMLGADCENLSITPLNDNAVCINETTEWLDTIPYLDTINSESKWSKKESLIYSYFWQMGGSAETKGYWKQVTTSGKYFIGFKILKENKTYFGWIGMKRGPNIKSFSFFITDFAILKESEE